MYSAKLNRLQKLHNRAARIIAHVPNEIDQKTVLNIPLKQLKQQRKKAKAKVMFKTLNNMGPNSLQKLFTFKKEILNHSLRGSSSLIRLPKPNTNNMKKSLCMMELHLELFTRKYKRKQFNLML